MSQCLRVLCVFDSPRDRETVRRVLSEASAGIRAAEAESREAFEAGLAAGEFDVILTDLGVLGFDGLSILDAIRAAQPRLPVLVVSGVDSAERAVEAIRRGAADYLLTTPDQLQRLPEAIRAAVERAEDGEGRPTGLLTVDENATVQRASAEPLRQERDMAQEYFDIAGVILLVLGTDRKVRLINRKGCEILGYTQEEIVGSDWFTRCLPERYRERVLQVFGRLMAGDVPGAEYVEDEIVTKSGERRLIA